MNIAFHSTAALFDVSKNSISLLQQKLSHAGQELSSGTKADIGLSLGTQTGHLLTLHQTASDLASLTQTNKIATTKLSNTQAALTSVYGMIDEFTNSLITSASGGTERSVLVQDAKNKLKALIGILAATTDGSYAFGGVNASALPLKDYLQAPTSPARSAVTESFQTAFGFSSDSTETPNITAQQMRNYIDGPLRQLFDSKWNDLFSSATDTLQSDRIADAEVISTTSSVNNSGIKDLVTALVTVVDSGVENLNKETYATLIEGITHAVGKAGTKIGEEQSSIAFCQQRLTAVDDRMSISTTLIEKQIASNEDVDIAKTSVVLNGAMLNLQASYAITARIQKMTILEYL